MLLAVLEARAGVAIGAQDVYLNVAGGLKVREPAADLAVAAALVSSLTGTVLPARGGVLRRNRALRQHPAGEPVGSRGSRRPPKLGLTEAVTRPRRAPSVKGIAVKAVETVVDLVALVAGG